MSKKIIIVIASILIAIIMASVITVYILSSEKNVLNPATSSERYEVRYAKRFSLEQKEGYVLVTDGQGRKIALVERGKPVPSGTFDLVIEFPVKRVVSLNDAHYYIPALNSTDVLVGVSSSTWYIEEIAKGVADGTIVDVGSSRSPDYEKIAQLNPDLIFISAEYVGETVADKLTSMGLPWVSIDAWVENNPLARVEWIKFVGAFINKSVEAYNYFEKIEGNILSITGKVGSSARPKVCYSLIYSKGISVPGNESYHAELVRMAGGEYIFNYLSGSGYVTVNKEEFLNRAMDSDVYIAIYMGTPVDKVADLTQYVPELAQTKPFISGRVYAMEPWIWQQICRMDEIIGDLAAIFHPDLFPNHHFTMFKKIG